MAAARGAFHEFAIIDRRIFPKNFRHLHLIAGGFQVATLR
jgi:hypothetical protein